MTLPQICAPTTPCLPSPCPPYCIPPPPFVPSFYAPNLCIPYPPVCSTAPPPIIVPPPPVVVCPPPCTPCPLPQPSCCKPCCPPPKNCCQPQCRPRTGCGGGGGCGGGCCPRPSCGPQPIVCIPIRLQQNCQSACGAKRGAKKRSHESSAGARNDKQASYNNCNFYMTEIPKALMDQFGCSTSQSEASEECVEEGTDETEDYASTMDDDCGDEGVMEDDCEEVYGNPTGGGASAKCTPCPPMDCFGMQMMQWASCFPAMANCFMGGAGGAGCNPMGGGMGPGGRGMGRGGNGRGRGGNGRGRGRGMGPGRGGRGGRGGPGSGGSRGTRGYSDGSGGRNRGYSDGCGSGNGEYNGSGNGRYNDQDGSGGYNDGRGGGYDDGRGGGHRDGRGTGEYSDGRGTGGYHDGQGNGGYPDGTGGYHDGRDGGTGGYNDGRGGGGQGYDDDEYGGGGKGKRGEGGGTGVGKHKKGATSRIFNKTAGYRPYSYSNAELTKKSTAYIDKSRKSSCTTPGNSKTNMQGQVGPSASRARNTTAAGPSRSMMAINQNVGVSRADFLNGNVGRARSEPNFRSRADGDEGELIPIYRTTTQTRLQIIDRPNEPSEVLVIQRPVQEVISYQKLDPKEQHSKVNLDIVTDDLTKKPAAAGGKRKKRPFDPCHPRHTCMKYHTRRLHRLCSFSNRRKRRLSQIHQPLICFKVPPCPIRETVASILRKRPPAHCGYHEQKEPPFHEYCATDECPDTNRYPLLTREFSPLCHEDENLNQNNNNPKAGNSMQVEKRGAKRKQHHR